MMNVPLSLKMSATWENEKLSSSIVSRICYLNITKVIFERFSDDVIDGNHNNFFVSVRMRDNTRRVLRSPELIFPPLIPGMVSLDFSCSIQYSHALKRDSCNYLQLLVQRRKKYKKKAVNLGYKTLAYCTIDLAQVLQKRIENKFLDLYDDPKSMANPVGKVEVKSLSSIPTTKDPVAERRKDFFEDEDEGMHEQFSEPDDSDRADDSDFEPNCAEFGEPSSRQKKIMKAMSIGVDGHRERRRSSSPSTTLPEWQKQIKQKIMNLLKKVKLMERSEELDPRETSQLWDEIDQLENVSEDSDIGDMDTLSIQSTPRPLLRPFFGLSGVKNQHGAYCIDYTVDDEPGAKLLKKLQLETSVIGQLTDSNAIFVDRRISAGEKLRNNDGSETTEDEIKSFTVKKQGGSHDKESSLQPPTCKTKSKLSKGCVQSTSNIPSKKDHQKPKKQLSEIIKTFSLSTTAPTISTSSITMTNSQRCTLADPNTVPIVIDNPNSLNVSSNFGSSIGSSLMTSSVILSPISFDSSKESSHSDYKGPTEINPRFELVEQVNQYLQKEVDSLDIIYVVNLSDYGGKYVSELLNKEEVSHIAVTSYVETRFAMIQILHKLRKRSEQDNRICLLGSDSHLNNTLRVFVDQINLNYSMEIANRFRFFLIPISAFSMPCMSYSHTTSSGSGNTGFNNMARRLCTVDSKYASLFSEFMQADNAVSSDSVIERDNKFLFGVHDYLQANGTLHCPIGDCLVACSVKPLNLNQDCDTSAESFIPFLCEVRLGETSDVQLNRHDGSVDDQWSMTVSSSPPHSPVIANVDSTIKVPQCATTTSVVCPPGSTSVSTTQSVTIPSSINTQSSAPDVASIELQLEYWTDNTGKKVTLKSAFRQVLVTPTIINSAGCSSQHALSMTVTGKEKKQKIMRIAKRPKNETGDAKKETFDDIVRILCTSKSQSSLIRVMIDGIVWSGVKFFQLNPCWRTQIKTFPVATFNNMA